MKVFITGSTCFVGQFLVEKLISRGHDLALLIRPGKPASRFPKAWLNHPKIKIVDGALESFADENYGEEIKRFSPDACIHLAWAHCLKEERNYFEHFDHNFIHSLQLVKFLSKTSCRYFLGLGSHAEYGVQNAKLTLESIPKPENNYGMSKYFTGLATAKLCSDFGIKHCWPRLIAAYGPGEPPVHFIPLVIDHFAQKKRLEMTAGEQLWDYVYIDDFVEALAVSLERQITGIFPFGSGSVRSLKEIVEILHRHTPDCPKPLLGARPYAPKEITYVTADIEPFQKMTGWTPKMDLETGLLQTLQFALHGD